MSPVDLFPLLGIDLFPSLAGGVRLSGCLQFMCLPLRQLICLPVLLVVSGSPDVSNSFGLRYIIHLSPNLAGGVRLSGCLQFICLPLKQFICLPVCPALRMCPIHLSPLTAIHLSPSLAGGVRLSPIQLSPLKAIHLSPSLAGGVRLSGCLQFICPVWLVVSGAPDVSNSFGLPYIIHLSPNLAGGVRLSGCLQFICLP